MDMIFGHLGNGLTRLPWEQESPGSNPGCPTKLQVYLGEIIKA